MLQQYRPQHQAIEEEVERDFFAHYYGMIKRRPLYVVLPFVLVLLAGIVTIAIQKPIYLAEGKILVESQEIPTDLVRPTVTSAANERIQVIRQRIMARDNLLGIVKKFGIFAAERKWMSGTQILDLMRARTQFKLVDIDLPTRRNNTIAFTVSFEHENPEIAMRVANEFVTLILNEDARTTTNRAIETTKFLAREVKRLEGQLGSIEAKIAEIKKRPNTEVPDQVLTQLASLKAELLQKRSVFSDAHPDIKILKQKIAALEKLVRRTPTVDSGIDALERQQESNEKDLEEATRKLAAARLGENLERDQQSERLLILEQPTLPQKPIRPHRGKLFVIALGLAAVAAFGTAFAADAFDK